MGGARGEEGSLNVREPGVEVRDLEQHILRKSKLIANPNRKACGSSTPTPTDTADAKAKAKTNATTYAHARRKFLIQLVINYGIRQCLHHVRIQDQGQLDPRTQIYPPPEPSSSRAYLPPLCFPSGG